MPGMTIVSNYLNNSEYYHDSDVILEVFPKYSQPKILQRPLVLQISFYCREIDILPSYSLIESVAILFTLLLEFTHVAMWMWRLVCGCTILHVYYRDREF